MKINKYPDGTSYYELITNNVNQEYTVRINSYEDLWHLNQLVDAHNNFMAKVPTITIPCLIDAQADKRFASNQSSGLKLVCKFLNSMNANFKIFHPHNPEVVEALMDNVEIIDNSYFINSVLVQTREIIKSEKENKLIVLLPDGGAYKWGVKLMDKLGFSGTVLACAKNRVYENGESTLKQQLPGFNFKGKDILIIDDICVYGGTFKGLSKLLREKNCGKLYLAVSHMTVQNLGEDPVTNYFDKVFTVNSKYNTYRAENNGTYTPENLEIIKLF